MTIYATDGQGSGYPFYTVDLKERRLIQVGTAGDFSYSSISYNPKNGLLYGVIWTGPHEDFFVIIDPKSGGVHRIASIVTGAKIAFAPDGTLYAIISGGYLDPGIESGQLYQINHETGGHKLIGMANLDYKSSRFFISKRGTVRAEHGEGSLPPRIHLG